jgi:glycosyltransferase involved in cell wall biosynthesis
MRFTIVVPAYNEERWLPATLGSLQLQDTDQPYEVVVVDNGSDDRTAEIAAAHGARVVWEPRRGVCDARQAGLAAARGDIVVSTDADTVHPVDWLSRIDAAFRARPEAVAVAGPCHYAQPPWWGRLFPALGFGLVAAGHGLTGRVGYLTATNVAYRRDGFPGYDTRLTQGGDETDLLRRLTAWGPVVWDHRNAVLTSSRRIRQGLWHTVVISYGYYYLGAVVLNRLTGRRLIGSAPTIR